VPILVFLGLSVLDLGPMYATDVRQTDVRQHHRLGHINNADNAQSADVQTAEVNKLSGCTIVHTRAHNEIDQ